MCSIKFSVLFPMAGSHSTYSGHANLPIALIDAHNHTQEVGYLLEAMKLSRISVTCEPASASELFEVAKLRAWRVDSMHHSGLDAYQAMVQLLPCLDLLSHQPNTDVLAHDATAWAL